MLAGKGARRICPGGYASSGNARAPLAGLSGTYFEVRTFVHAPTEQEPDNALGERRPNRGSVTLS